MHPLVLAGGAAVLGYLGFKAMKKQEAADLQQKQLWGASELLTGHTYTVQASIDTSKLGTQDPSTASAVIKSTFEQLGWRVTGSAQPKGSADMQALAEGKPSQWMIQGVWTKPEKFMTTTPQWLGMAVAYEAPVPPMNVVGPSGQVTNYK